jgi:hypothetical protein
MIVKLKISSTILAFILFIHSTSFANDTLQVTQLLQRIQQLQVKSDGVFPKGLFPCYRMYAFNKDRAIADPNIFFTATIVYTLQSLIPSFTHTQVRMANKIIQDAIPVFSKYKNQKGRPTYNFWTTDTVSFFPNSGFLSKFTKTHSLPDDLDDTSLISMLLAVNDSTAIKVHEIMQDFNKNNKKEINHFFKDYQKLDTYSLWFGKKMPVEIDISVLCNVMLFVQSYNLPWTKTDSSTIQLIAQVIKDKNHLNQSGIMSHYYATPALILYHLSRLMAKKEIPVLTILKPQMIDEAKALLSNSTSFVEKIILSTTLMRWNIQPEINITEYPDNLENLIEEDQEFAFFIANLAYLLPNVPDNIKKWSGNTGMGKFYFYCPALNNLFLLENHILQQSLQSSSKN